jgi:hypothetical protein
LSANKKSQAEYEKKKRQREVELEVWNLPFFYF